MVDHPVSAGVDPAVTGGPPVGAAGEFNGPAPQREWLLPGADELFRSIYTRSGTGAGDTLAICSAIAGEGKTTIALGLSVTLAQDYPDRQVLLVETDYERPALAKDFGVPPNPGLIDCLLDNQPIWSAYRATFLENLHLLPAGGPAAHAGRVLRSSRIAVAMDTIRQSYDTIILDLPAMLTNSDALPLLDLADGVVFVVRAGVTPAALVNKAIAELDDSRGRFRGVVLNGAQSGMPGWLRRLCGL